MASKENLIILTTRAYGALHEKDLPLAFELFTRVLSEYPDNETAAYELARFYDEGNVVGADKQKALQLYELAAENIAEAQERLAEIYEAGECTAPDRQKAQMLRERAAKQKSSDHKPLTLAESIRRKVEQVQGIKNSDC